MSTSFGPEDSADGSLVESKPRRIASTLARVVRRPEGTGPSRRAGAALDRLRVGTVERLPRKDEPMLAAQRRVATLVAAGAPPAEVFAAVAEQVADVIGVPVVVVWRHQPDGTGTVIGAWSDVRHPFQPGSRWFLDGSTIADAQRQAGMRSSAGAPITVDGAVWGSISVLSTRPAPLPADTEHRLAEITQLVATAISNSAGREELARLAGQEAALRRVATLVARGVPPPEVFAAVAREVGLLLGVDATYLARYDLDRTATGVATWSPAGDDIPVGRRVTLEGDSVVGIVSRTGRPARMDRYEHAAGAAAALVRELGLGSSVGAPIVVNQRLWGVMIVSLRQDDRTLPPDTESRVAAFTELVATAISNTESRTEVARLAEEQAALRRVATLVARGVPEGELFGAVIGEVGRLFGAELARMVRYDAAVGVASVAAWAAAGDPPPWPDRWPTDELRPANLIATTRRAVRIDWSDVAGTTATTVRDLGIRSSVASPILVGGRLWGALVVHGRRPDPFPVDTESRLEKFTELVATAISNIEARAALAASRARVVAAAEDERRRVVRDLHDGAQQRLVRAILTLKVAHQALEHEQRVDLPAAVSEALDDAQHAMDELRELAHGILPATLRHGGLRAGVNELAGRMPLPVETRVFAGRLPATIEATAYFVIAEALTNIAKHARARHGTVTAAVEGGTLRVRVRDDGIGGARPDGSGLLGMADRLAALGGQLRIETASGDGTLVAADFPLPP
jgi:signal transduction histidine kinase